MPRKVLTIILELCKQAWEKHVEKITRAAIAKTTNCTLVWNSNVEIRVTMQTCNAHTHTQQYKFNFKDCLSLSVGVHLWWNTKLYYSTLYLILNTVCCDGVNMRHYVYCKRNTSRHRRRHNYTIDRPSVRLPVHPRVLEPSSFVIP